MVFYWRWTSPGLGPSAPYHNGVTLLLGLESAGLLTLSGPSHISPACSGSRPIGCASLGHLFIHAHNSLGLFSSWNTVYSIYICVITWLMPVSDMDSVCFATFLPASTLSNIKRSQWSFTEEWKPWAPPSPALSLLSRCIHSNKGVSVILSTLQLGISSRYIFAAQSGMLAGKLKQTRIFWWMLSVPKSWETLTCFLLQIQSPASVLVISSSLPLRAHLPASSLQLIAIPSQEPEVELGGWHGNFGDTKDDLTASQ